jgi:hypothetical protein
LDDGKDSGKKHRRFVIGDKTRKGILRTLAHLVCHNHQQQPAIACQKL